MKCLFPHIVNTAKIMKPIVNIATNVIVRLAKRNQKVLLSETKKYSNAVLTDSHGKTQHAQAAI